MIGNGGRQMQKLTKWAYSLIGGVCIWLLAMLVDHQLGGRMQDKKKVWGWLLICALLILVIRLLGGCASAPVQTARIQHDTVTAFFPTVLELDSSSKNDGEVQCSANNVPYIKIKRRFFPDSMTQWRRRLLIHEETHVRQGLAYGNCFEWRKKIASDQEFRFNLEAEAYCATWVQERKEHIAHWWSIDGIAEFLQRTIWPSLTIEEATNRLPCREGGADAYLQNPARIQRPTLL